MAMKCCTKLETANERCPIVFQSHPSNFKVTRYKTSPILTQIGRFLIIGQSQLWNPSDLPCFRSCIKFQGHTGWKIDDLDKIWARLLGRSQLSTIDIGLDSGKPWIQAGTLRPELDHNTVRHFDTPLRLVTSRPSFCQTRHLASHNISAIVHETSKFRYTWRESWCNCVWKTLYFIFTLNSPA